jgi:ATP-dependent Zn protease
VQRVLAERHTAVQGLLTAARCQLEVLTQALLEHETLDQQALCTLLGPRPVRVASMSGEPQEITVAG